MAEQLGLLENHQYNPYLNGRREWNERYGDYIAQAHHWRLVAIIALAVALVAVAGVIWIGQQNKMVPYVVAVDKLGAAAAVGRADEARPADERVVRAQLARFISTARSVSPDIAAEREALKDCYATVSRSSPAYSALNEYFRSHSPFERASTETVSVEVRSVLPLSGESWRVEWDEQTRARDGRIQSTETWSATLQVSIVPPTEEGQIIRNPMGVYITSFSWAKRM